MDIPFPRPEEERFSPAALALATFVHLLLAGALFFGVQWKRQAPSAVAVELWGVDVPAASRGRQVAPTVPEPMPEVRPEPEPELKLGPKPEPLKPDITVKDEKKPKPQPKKPAPERRMDFRDQLDRESAQIRKQAQQRALQEARMASSERIAAQLAAERGSSDGSSSGGRGDTRGLEGYGDKVRNKIRRNIVLPPGIPGNPEAIFIVRQLPSGDVIGEPRMIQSSGHRAYDEAVVRAIKKSSPLPKPDDPSQFQRELKLHFWPFEKD